MKKNERNNKKKWIAILIIAVIILLVTIVAVAFGMNKGNDGTTGTTETTSSVSSSATTENSTKDNSEAETKENTYYWLITDKKTGITVDSKGWTDAKDYNGVSWAKAPTEELPYVWCYATDPDGKVVIEPTLWYEYKADSSTAASTETASLEKPSTEDTEEKPGSNTNNSGSGNNGGSNTGNSGNSGSSNSTTPTTTEKPSGSNGGNNGGTPTTTQTTTQAPATTQEPTTTQAPTTTQTTTQAAAVCPPHNYVYVVTEEKGHYDYVEVKAAWDEKVKVGSYNQCNGCGINLSNMSEESMTAHLLRCTDDGTSYHLESIYETVHHEAEYDYVWVVDEQPKYLFICSICGRHSSGSDPYNNNNCNYGCEYGFIN